MSGYLGPYTATLFSFNPCVPERPRERGVGAE
jgi:hypothetical protein